MIVFGIIYFKNMAILLLLICNIIYKTFLRLKYKTIFKTKIYDFFKDLMKVETFLRTCNKAPGVGESSSSWCGQFDLAQGGGTLKKPCQSPLDLGFNLYVRHSNTSSTEIRAACMHAEIPTFFKCHGSVSFFGRVQVAHCFPGL